MVCSEARLRRALLAVLGMVLFVSAVEGCATLHGQSRELFDAREILNTEINVASCLRVSLERGQVGLAKSILELYEEQHEGALVGVLEGEVARLKQLQAEVVQSESTVEPVAKWGQNQTHLFLSLKMSHRWDSPPCLNSKHQQAHSSQQLFNYTNICLVSNSRITFSFLLHFYDAISPQPVAVSSDGVGIYSAIIEKAEPKIWPFLARNEKIYPIWAEISERHNAAHKEYQNLLDGILRARKSKPVILEEDKKEAAPSAPEHQATNSPSQVEEAVADAAVQQADPITASQKL